MQRPHWRKRPTDALRSRSLAARLNLSPVTAQCLLHRGFDRAEDARGFLRPALTQLHDPHAFGEMRTAATRLHRAARDGERIVIVGDYDVDGITATALLVRLLKLLGAQVEAIIPSRLRDGYGMRPSHAAAAAQRGAAVVVTVDNGTTAFSAAAEAERLGLDLIITDHHEPRIGDDGAPVRPRCLALLNPKMPGAGYPFAGLAGCGVAFKLAWALATEASPGERASPRLRSFLLDALALVAVGTVADAVPLSGENRVLVHYGLRALAATESLGLRALLRVAKLRAAPTATDIAFQLAPRLNAAGRMGRADLALDLLVSENAQTSTDLASQLDTLNQSRRELEHDVLEQALEQADSSLANTDGAALVLASQGWHAGVIGIVASRLVERFHRPCVLIGLDGERGRGSARSIPGVALHNAFTRCDDLLERHGGHAMAAGLEIRTDRVASFRERFGGVVRRQLDAAPAAAEPEPLEIDLELGLGELSHGLIRELDRLGPHGKDNRAPVFSASGLRLAAPPRVVGRDSRHVQLTLRQGGCVRRAIGFRLADRVPELQDAEHGINAAFRPIISRFRGNESVELELVDVRAV
jgi:single-stranded-DNA-specific exonuclease